MDHKYIQSISIDWNQIDHDSYWIVAVGQEKCMKQRRRK